MGFSFFYISINSLFSCITKWLKEKKRCPNCNAAAKSSDIRVLFASSVLHLPSLRRSFSQTIIGGFCGSKRSGESQRRV